MSEEFERLPHIGPVLVQRLREELDAHSLTALAEAARDGRLDTVSGIGPRRASQLRQVLANRLMVDAHPASIPVDVLLSLDEEFRRAYASGTLPRVPPPPGSPDRGWRAVLHRRVGGHAFVVYWSDSEQARSLGRDRDWVVVRGEDQANLELATVVTERAGPRAGRRVVRGREEEC